MEGRIREICRRDVHAGEDGIYTIRSVYFDDYKNTCFYENENGTDPREKFRIRIYNGNKERITLECKQKTKGLNRKLSCPLTKSQCQAILDGSFSSAHLQAEGLQAKASERELLMKFFLRYRMRFFRARVVVEYERTPYVYSLGNVRITFDRNISSSAQTERFLEPVLRLKPVMPPGKHILEVKYDELLPDYLYNALQLENLRQTAYSKYYICRKSELQRRPE